MDSVTTDLALTANLNYLKEKNIINIGYKDILKQTNNTKREHLGNGL